MILKNRDGPGGEERSGISHLFRCAGLVLLFALLVTLVSLAYGVSPPLPLERVSPALGYNPALPLLVAVIGYLGGRAWQFAQIDPIGRAVLLQRMQIDLAYLALFVVVTYFHFVLKLQIPMLRQADYDELLFSLDLRLVTVIALLSALRNKIAQVLPYPDAWYQLCQMGVYVLSFWGHALGKRRFFHPWMTASLLNLMLGALAYLVFPAIGPFLYESGPNRLAFQAEQVMAKVATSVAEDGAKWLLLHGNEFFTSAPAAMPSLHVSIACIAGYYAIRARLKTRFVILPMAIWIPLEAVVARWHYLADVPAGVLFAMAVIALSNRLCRVSGTVCEPVAGSRAL